MAFYRDQTAVNNVHKKQCKLETVVLNSNCNVLNVFISGGVSIVDTMTDGKYSQNFVGCIETITIHNKGPLGVSDALSGFNVEEC